MIRHLVQTPLDRQHLALKSYTAKPIAGDFLHQTVAKPWGHEFCLYHNDQVQVWQLGIKQNHATSLHCHPQKRTALCVLDGRVRFSSLSEETELKPLDIVAIDPGAFHSTHALDPQGAIVLEFETPPLKHDLVRLEDRYGRENQGYESVADMAAVPAGFSITAADGIERRHGNVGVALHPISEPGTAAAFLAGGGKAVVVSGQIRNDSVTYGVCDVIAAPLPADARCLDAAILVVRPL